MAYVTDIDNIEKLSLLDLIPNCHNNPNDWITVKLIDLKVILEYKVPKDAKDDVCNISLKVSDNDINSPMTAEKIIQINVIA